jgi:hypothetical protein
MKTDPLQKHEDECMERKLTNPKLRLVCTCDLTDEEVVSHIAFASAISTRITQNDES